MAGAGGLPAAFGMVAMDDDSAQQLRHPAERRRDGSELNWLARIPDA
jgi:hypothetical protein